MRNLQTPQALQAALQFLMTSDIPTEHKTVLIETVTQALRNLDSDRQAAEEVPQQWHAAETAQLQGVLRGKVANSWQEADELSMHLAAQLHRDLYDIRAKATELGFGVAVDYRLAKARVQSGGE